jgi:L-amino acid N-acyltransferase YncA
VQVGAIAGPINDIIGILAKPSGKGHGSQFLKMLIIEARSQGKKNFIVRDVIGETEEDQIILEHILEKLGFNLVDKDMRTWNLIL